MTKRRAASRKNSVQRWFADLYPSGESTLERASAMLRAGTRLSNVQQGTVEMLIHALYSYAAGAGSERRFIMMLQRTYGTGQFSEAGYVRLVAEWDAWDVLRGGESAADRLRDEFARWLLRPQRVPRTQREWAREHRVGESTVSRWKAGTRRAPRQIPLPNRIVNGMRASIREEMVIRGYWELRRSKSRAIPYPSDLIDNAYPRQRMHDAFSGDGWVRIPKSIEGEQIREGESDPSTGQPTELGVG